MPYLFGGIVGLLLIALWIWVILDVISTPAGVSRNLPKPIWLVLVIVLPEIGSIAWLIFGRPETGSYQLGGGYAPPTRPSGPAPLGIEDRDDWPEQARRILEGEEAKPTKEQIRKAADERSRKLREWEANLLKREKELHEKQKREEEGDS